MEENSQKFFAGKKKENNTPFPMVLEIPQV